MSQHSISSLDLGKTYSYADYLNWKFQERLELLLGKVFKMSPAPNTKHQKISARLFYAIFQFFEKETCEVFSAPFDVRLPHKSSDSDHETHTVVQPDICVVCDLEKLDQRGCKGAPDLVVEILSPGNTKKEMDIKFRIYQEAGVKEYWMLEPNDEIALIYVVNAQGNYIGLPPVTIDHAIESATFEGLHIELNKVFS